MPKRIAVTALLLACIPALAQPAPEGPVLRISTTLVQVDAVVTDRKGLHVADLRAEDFEIRQNGKPQKITHFSYVQARAEGVRETPPTRDKSAPPLPPVPMGPLSVKRTIAIVVDDLGLSFESMVYTRWALEKFIGEQTEPGDLIAILRTGAGSSAFQQFTSDRRILHAAIRQLRWNPRSRMGAGVFPAIEPDDPAVKLPGREGAVEKKARRGELPLAGEYVGPGDKASAAENRRVFSELEREQFEVGTLGAVGYVIHGLQEMPGRKSVVLVSDDLRVYQRESHSRRVLDALRRIADQANRAAVVIYTLNARGLTVPMLRAEDQTLGLGANELMDAVTGRVQENLAADEGLVYLAAETGGLFFHNNNDLAGGIRKALDDQSGYYLIGYQPEQETFHAGFSKEAVYHTLSVRVTRPGLSVRSRKGFYGVPDLKTAPVFSTPQAQVAAALRSPFAGGDIRLRLTSLFRNHAKDGPYILSLLHIEGEDLSLTEESGGRRKGQLEINVVSFDANGNSINQSGRAYSLDLSPAIYSQVHAAGLTCRIIHRTKRHGAFQLRAVVRDAVSGKLGSASQFIETPNLKEKHLALSGILMHSSMAQSGREDPGEGDVIAGPAVRIFRPGEPLAYVVEVYNAELGLGTRNPDLSLQIRLFREGQLVYATAPQDVSIQANNTQQFFLAGSLRLQTGMKPGTYVLQLVATDKLADAKHRAASQWIDFEVSDGNAAAQ